LKTLKRLNNKSPLERGTPAFAGGGCVNPLERGTPAFAGGACVNPLERGLPKLSGRGVLFQLLISLYDLNLEKASIRGVHSCQPFQGLMKLTLKRLQSVLSFSSVFSRVESKQQKELALKRLQSVLSFSSVFSRIDGANLEKATIGVIFLISLFKD